MSNGRIIWIRLIVAFIVGGCAAYILISGTVILLNKMLEQKTGYWKCVCGQVHKIDGKPIRCVGPGHSVYLAPEYFTYTLEEKKVKQTNPQLKLL